MTRGPLRVRTWERSSSQSAVSCPCCHRRPPALGPRQVAARAERGDKPIRVHPLGIRFRLMASGDLLGQVLGEVADAPRRVL